jgi:hypothetical protein
LSLSPRSMQTINIDNIEHPGALRLSAGSLASSASRVPGDLTLCSCTCSHIPIVPTECLQATSPCAGPMHTCLPPSRCRCCHTPSPIDSPESISDPVVYCLSWQFASLMFLWMIRNALVSFAERLSSFVCRAFVCGIAVTPPKVLRKRGFGAGVWALAVGRLGLNRPKTDLTP